MQQRVADSEDGLMLRTFLRQSMLLSYTALKKAKWHGSILVNGEAAQVDRILRAGDNVSVSWAEPAPAYTPKPCAGSVPVLWEDEHLMILDKPAPMASQSSAGHPDDSLENILYHMLGRPADYIYRPVNRLDKGTSGIMVAARTAHAQQLLQKQLHTDRFRRIYLAVTDGNPAEDQGIISLPIAKSAGNTIRRIIDENGKPSVTHYQVLMQGGSRSLLRLELETGRTHQIRVHLSAIGCPVAGDFLYGSETPELPGRFALHSHELFLTHPITGAQLHVVSPCPEALMLLPGLR